MHGLLQGAGEDQVGDPEEADHAGEGWARLQGAGHINAISRLSLEEMQKWK